MINVFSTELDKATKNEKVLKKDKSKKEVNKDDNPDVPLEAKKNSQREISGDNDYTKYFKKDAIKASELSLTRLSYHLRNIRLINRFNTHMLATLVDKINVKYFEIPDIKAGKTGVNKHTVSRDIKNRISIFFSMQVELSNDLDINIRAIESLIRFQSVLAKNYTSLLGFITSDEHLSSLTSTWIPDSKTVDTVKDYVDQLKVIKANDPKKEMVFANEYDEAIYNRIKVCLSRVIKDVLRKDQTNVIAYGSYTSYLLDPEITYNDIDIYHAKSVKFSVCLMLTVYFITGHEFKLLHIPYIPGYLSLQYKDYVLLDIINVDHYTQSFLKPVMILEVKNVNPILQFTNNVKMLAEPFRTTSVNLNPELFVKKQVVLLNYVSNKIQELKYDLELPTYKIVRDCIVFTFKGFEVVKMVVIQNPLDLINFIKHHPDSSKTLNRGVEGKFSKKFHAFNNEIMFLASNDDSSAKGGKVATDIKKKDVQKAKEDAKKSTSLQSKRASEVIATSKNDSITSKEDELNQLYKELLKEIGGSKTLVITHHSTTLYRTHKKLHPLSFISCLANYVSFHILHSFKDQEKAFNVLISAMAKTKMVDTEGYMTVPRYKLKGIHLSFSLAPTFMFPKMPFDDYSSKNEEEWMNKEDFLNTNYMY